MLSLLWLIPAIPFAGFAVLALFGPRMPRRAIAVTGVGTIAASAVISILVTISFLSSPPPGYAYAQYLWTWIDVAGFVPAMALYLDPLSLVMVLVVAFVSFWIHLYSVEFMAESEGYNRFFAYMNLFVASMITLLLGNNLLLLFLGWEGVGLCSYLLIGFWYQDAANGRAGQKAFIVTRVGDTAFTIGLLILFTQLGTLNIQELMQRVQQQWPVGSAYAIAAAALLLGGAVGKSAQLPLQTWLPDAMAGPTPTSALIHAATMVTAGVYLIARTHVLFAQAPPVQFAVAVIGAATLLMAGFSALTQWDIKRALAYSTISQIGYMFLALGVGAWAAAIFHFMTHAFFKALLFLAAGIVIEALHHEHNIMRMGGLRKDLPAAFWTFLIGGCALAGLPYITAGYYSKDLILWRAWSAELGSPGLWGAGLAGVLLTSLYTFRLVFLVFFGERKTHVSHVPGYVMKVPALVLSFFSITAGFVNVPPRLGNVRHLSGFLYNALPESREVHAGWVSETVSEIAAGALFFIGLLLAYYFFYRKPSLAKSLAETGIGRTLHRFWFADWGFDWLYDRAFVRPVVWLAQADKHDFIDGFYNGTAAVARAFWQGLSVTETGRVRWYAAGIALGTIVYIVVVLLS